LDIVYNENWQRCRKNRSTRRYRELVKVLVDALSRKWIVVSLFFLTMALLFTFPVGDGDFFWHVKTGQWIWQHHGIPSADPFSYTVTDVNPFRPESHRIPFLLKQYWLGQLSLFGIWQAGGEAGMVLFRSLAYTGILAFLYWWINRIRQGFIPLLAVFLAGNVLHSYPNERPQIFAFILMPLMLYLLEQVRSREEAVTPVTVLALPLVMLVWSNCHGSFILGIALVALYGATYLIGRIRGGKAPGKKTLAVLAAAILVTALNPNGLRAFGEFFGVSRNYMGTVAENISPLALAWRHHTFDWFYWALLILTLATVVLRFRKIDSTHLLVILSLLGLSLTGVRYLPFFVLAVPLVSLYLPEVNPKGPGAILPLVAILVWMATGDYRNVLKFRAERTFPVAAARFLESVRPAGRMFNHIDWGGYLMCYTNYPVFVDGRALVEEFVTLHNNVLAGAEWQKILTDYRANMIIMPGTQLLDGNAYPILLQLLDSAEWALVFQDDCALIFLRRGTGNDSIIGKYAVSKSLITRHIQARWQWQFTNNF
jgi:hypothetical protein